MERSKGHSGGLAKVFVTYGGVGCCAVLNPVCACPNMHAGTCIGAQESTRRSRSVASLSLFTANGGHTLFRSVLESLRRAVSARLPRIIGAPLSEPRLLLWHWMHR